MRMFALNVVVPEEEVEILHSEMNVKILTSEMQVAALADEWRQLQADVGRIPFTDYDFYDAWWRHFGKPQGKIPCVVVGRVNERLVAILPLCIWHTNHARILQTIGTDVYYLSDSLQKSPEQAKALWKTARQSRLYDFAIIEKTDPDSTCGQVLASFAKRVTVDKAP